MFGFLPHSLFTNHVGQSSSGLSPRLWSQVSGTLMQADGSKRLYLVGDDFSHVETSNSLTEISSEQNYVGFASDTSNNRLTGAVDEIGGVIQMSVDTGGGGNEAVDIELGANTATAGQLGRISDTTAVAGTTVNDDAYLTAFECRVKWHHEDDALTDGDMVSYIGLVGPGAGGGAILTSTSGIPTVGNHGIGFHIPEDDGDTVNFVYEAAGQTRVDAISDIAALTDDEYVKLGFIYDPDEVAAKRIKVYVDNVENSTYVTATNIAAATFPDNEALTFAAGLKVIVASNLAEMSVDWWAFAQVLK